MFDSRRSVRWLGRAGLLLYLLSMGLPAMVLAGDLMWGFMAVPLSVLGVGFLGEASPPGEQFYYGIACLLGVIANASFLLGGLVWLVRDFTRLSHPPHIVSGCLAACAVLAGVGAAVALLLSGERFLPQVGMLAWLASFAMLATAAVRLHRQRELPGGFPVVLPSVPAEPR